MRNLYIDIGSTNIKYSSDGEDILSVPFPQPCLNDGTKYEVSVDSILDTVRGIITSQPAKNVYLSVQMHGYVLSDFSHKPLTPYISWRDKRFCLLKEKYPFPIKPQYGVKEKDNLAAFSLYEQSKTMHNFDKIRFFDTLGSYIAFSLTGISATHITDACASGFFTTEGELNEIAKNPLFAGISFPHAEKNFKVCGRFGDKAIYLPVGDQQASVLGAGAEDECLLNTGTAVQACVVEKGFVEGDFESRPFFGDKTLCTVSGLSASAVFGSGTEQEIEKNYLSAIEKLPKRKKLSAVGGLAEHNSAFFERFGRKYFSEYELKKNSGAIKGLMKLANERQKGMMLSEIPFSNMPVILKNEGFNFFIIDCEHGGFDYADVSKIIMTAKLMHLTCIIRLAGNYRKDITKYMDMGADGVLLCMTGNAEDIGKVVEYAKYAPLGKRGISTMRAHTLYDPPELLQYMKEANSRTKVYAQIESLEGLDNIDSILSVKGVDGCILGPNDLSCEYGCIGEKNAPQIVAAIEYIAQRCENAGKESGIITSNQIYLKKAADCNMQMYCVGSELNMLQSGAKQTAERIRSL